MAQKLSLIEVLRQAPPIHVFKFVPFVKVESMLLKPSKRDLKYESMGDFIGGDGTLENPYHYSIPRDVSPRFAIIDLWLRFRGQGFNLVFIEVNDWLLRVRFYGVTAEDGCFTKLSPENKGKE